MRKKPVKQEQWHSVTDMSGRGFKQAHSTLGQGKNSRSKVRTAADLDQGNRFFTDNKRIYETYGSLRKSYQDGFGN